MCNPLTSATCLDPDRHPGPVTLPASPPAPSAWPAWPEAPPRPPPAGSPTPPSAGLAGAIQDAIGTIAKDMVAWWVNLPSPDLAADPVPRTLQAWLFPFTAAVAMVAMITAGARMALTRKAAPLVDVGSGPADRRDHRRGRDAAAHPAAEGRRRLQQRGAVGGHRRPVLGPVRQADRLRRASTGPGAPADLAGASA